MKKILSVLICALMMASLLAMPAVAEAPQKELTVAIQTSVTTLDPALNYSTHMSQIMMNTGGAPVRVLADGTMANYLCESIETSEDGLTYTYTIKDGILWSDGEPLVADHFVFAYKRVIGYGPDNSYTAQNLVNFVKGGKAANDAMLDVADMTDVGIYAVDDKTFVIELESTCPYFARLGVNGSFSPVRPDFAIEHESAWSLAPGYPAVGPFVLESLNANEGATFVKNELYYDAENIQLDKLHFVVMPDENAQLNAFKAGEIDVALAVPAELASSTEYTDYFYKMDSYTCNYFVCLNSGAMGPEALKDVNVRRALALAIDKDFIIEMLDGGPYITELNGYVPYGFEGNTDDFRKEKNDYLPYDLDAAVALLEAAGYGAGNPLKLEYLYSNAQFHGDVAQLLQQCWAMAGIEVTLKSVEGGVFYDFVDNGDFQMSRYAIADTSDPLSYFRTWLVESQIEPAVNDPAYEAMVADAMATVDHTEYIDKLHAIEDYFVEEMVYMLPLFTQESVVLRQTYVDGMWLTPGGIINVMDTGIV